MRCPKCKSYGVAVIGSKRDDEMVTRRRKCLDCDHRFNSIEITQMEYNILRYRKEVVDTFYGRCDSLAEQERSADIS